MGLCEKEILGSNTLYSVYPKNDKYDLLFLLACLNSSFVKDYWKAKYSDNKALFPKIKGFQLKELPIPVVSKEQQMVIVALVENILSAKRMDENFNTEEIESQIDEIISDLYKQ